MTRWRCSCRQGWPVANLSVPTTATHTVVGMCEAHSDVFRVICGVHRTNVERYVRAWGAQGYGFSFYDHLPDGVGGRHMTWYKIPVLYKAILTPGVETAFWMDSDSLFMTLSKPLPVPSAGKYLAVSTHSLPSAVAPDYINAGHLALRRGNYTEELLRTVWATCPVPWTITYTGTRGPPPFNATQLDRAKVDHEEQAALIFVMGGSKSECRDSMGGSSASDQNCLLLHSTPEYDILPAPVMNGNVPHFKTGDLVLHLWGWQCDWSIGALINASWEVPVGGSGYNLTDRKLQIAEVLEQAGKDPRNASLEKRMSDTCIVQDHEKAYIMTVLDAPIGSLNAAKATGHPDGSDLIRGVAADPILVQHGGAGSSDALLLNGGEGGSGDDDADELEYIDELVDGGNKAFSGRGPEMVALQGVLQP